MPIWISTGCERQRWENPHRNGSQWGMKDEIHYQWTRLSFCFIFSAVSLSRTLFPNTSKDLLHDETSLVSLTGSPSPFNTVFPTTFRRKTRCKAFINPRNNISGSCNRLNGIVCSIVALSIPIRRISTTSASHTELFQWNRTKATEMYSGRWAL